VSPDMSETSIDIHVLVVEDSEDDALLVTRELRRNGYNPIFERVDTAETMTAALDSHNWDIIISDYAMPCFNAPDALKLTQQKGLDIPFIIVSGVIGEETAVAIMKAGAHDYITKGNLARLTPAIEREIREAKSRREKRQAEKDLLKSEVRYRNLFENASDAVIVYDSKGNITMANQAMARFTGYGLDQLLMMSLSQLLAPSSLQYALEMPYGNFADSDEDVIQSHELQVVTKDGAERTVQWVTSVIYTEEHATVLQAVLRDITAEKQERENARIYTMLVTRAQEDERKRISRELHDETVQQLCSLGFDIDLLIGQRGRQNKEITAGLHKLRQKLDQVSQGVRRFSQELRPAVLEDFGLLDGIRWLVDDVSSQYGINSSLKIEGKPRRLSPQVELILYRITQEALNNVRRHSQATETAVRFEFAADKVTLTVTDNGRGFKMPETKAGFVQQGNLGILGMYERAFLVNGSCSVQSEVGKGTKVIVEVNT